MRLIVLLICGLMAGCAARGAAIPTIANHNNFIVGVRLWQDSGGCNQVIAYADGTVEHAKKAMAFCERAAIWAKAAAPKPSAAPAADPGGPK